MLIRSCLTGNLVSKLGVIPKADSAGPASSQAPPKLEHHEKTTGSCSTKINFFSSYTPYIKANFSLTPALASPLLPPRAQCTWVIRANSLMQMNLASISQDLLARLGLYHFLSKANKNANIDPKRPETNRRLRTGKCLYQKCGQKNKFHWKVAAAIQEFKQVQPWRISRGNPSGSHTFESLIYPKKWVNQHPSATGWVRPASSASTAANSVGA